MNVLVIGSGGREHALSWKLGQSPLVDTVYCAPGNAAAGGMTPVAISDLHELADFAEANGVGLTVVGPEAPLCAGAVDIFRERGLVVFGPTRQAAQLEGSKTFAKAFMTKYGIPTGAAGTFTDAESAIACIRDQGAPVVVKADGLAAGKGVVVAETEEEAIQAVRDCFAGAFGDAGRTVLIEECLVGEEASIIALTDGETIIPLASSQDHKRIGEGDTGANTGGMGAYSPAPVVTDELWEQIRVEVLDRFVDGCRGEGLDFRGVIYAGIMVTDTGPKVLEFNVRFGDPETQAILPRMESDLAEAMLACVDRRLADVTLEWRDSAAVCVVLASAGYPGPYEKGLAIEGIADAEGAGAVVFHAGTTMAAGRCVTAGGRVLGVTALGATVAEAIASSYRAVDCISWQGVTCRRDIGHRALARDAGR